MLELYEEDADEGRAEMPENWWAFPAGHPKHKPGWGGPTEAAKLLTTLGYGHGAEISRQAVYSLWKHRRANGFPDRERVDVTNGWRQLFDLEKVRTWAEAKMKEREEEKS
jgi:hypothetical protein